MPPRAREVLREEEIDCLLQTEAKKEKQKTCLFFCTKSAWYAVWPL